ncbi:hypothetical protein CBR_g40718 [Chara braunii]|nr:hypothetical protein CBR_g40718 [Chara braunii]|eukprot:GBG85906.1 hypothetical protein CBR_g40718 [Chara braunii]
MMAVAIGMVVLVAYAPTVAGDGGYQCWAGMDHGPSTIKKINCKKNPHAASLDGCQQKCNMNANCGGIVFINGGVQHWRKGKYCCILKSDIEEESFMPEFGSTLCEVLED